MEYVTLVFALFGAISLAAIILYYANKLTRGWDELFGGCLLIPLYMLSLSLVGFSIVPFKNCTIDLKPSHAKHIIDKFREQNDSLKNEIAIYKGMAYDVKGVDLEDVVFYITSNQKFYHCSSDCAGLSLEIGKVKHEKLEDAINEGRVSCSLCDKVKSSRYDFRMLDNEESSVYICTGESSRKYHYDRDCKGLSCCSGEIEEVSEEEAEGMGRTSCKICNENK